MYILPKKQLTSKVQLSENPWGKKRPGTHIMSQWFYVTGHWLAAYTQALWFTALECCCARQEHTGGRSLWRICKWLILCKTLETSNNLGSDQKLLVAPLTNTIATGFKLSHYDSHISKPMNPFQVLYTAGWAACASPTRSWALEGQEPSQRILSLYLGVTGTKLSSSYLELKIEPTNLWFLS